MGVGGRRRLGTRRGCRRRAGILTRNRRDRLAAVRPGTRVGAGCVCAGRTNGNRKEGEHKECGEQRATERRQSAGHDRAEATRASSGAGKAGGGGRLLGGRVHGERAPVGERRRSQGRWARMSSASGRARARRVSARGPPRRSGQTPRKRWEQGAYRRGGAHPGKKRRHGGWGGSRHRRGVSGDGNAR